MSNDKRKGRSRQLLALQYLDKQKNGRSAFNLEGFPKLTQTYLDLIELGYVRRERLELHASRKCTVLTLTEAGEMILTNHNKEKQDGLN